ncbi:AzlC family ABC transporter permease [Tsukamurella sp. 8F]|uniref:AzlC family ABC transporter permease n=1 Tax=unclassified Tsukamurella TaxID=2633480 RepID=UPI0023B98771|nr:MULTISPECIES: AzlC family ABC transporter permease [unclassified Tsukamurella]MDF0532494.1 AzlC family ABC transporter permease [Tsukamurella sp. 8J]MDF0589165.1 AzlC family ABC transporter permease [Tsukamurella sp. 8F]
MQLTIERDDLRAAGRDAGVVWLGLFTLGIGFGVVVTSHGLPWWLAPVVSATVFAGSLEFLLVGLIAASAPLATIAVTTLLVNSRHLFYGLTFPVQRVRSRAGRCYSVFALCDEAYALISGPARRGITGARMLWTQAGLHVSWALGAGAGAVVGTAFLRDVRGLDFVLTALFVVLALDAYRAAPDRSTMMSAVACTIVAVLLLPGAALPVAMVALTATFVVRHRGRGRAHA